MSLFCCCSSQGGESDEEPSVARTYTQETSPRVQADISKGVTLSSIETVAAVLGDDAAVAKSATPDGIEGRGPSASIFRQNLSSKELTDFEQTLHRHREKLIDTSLLGKSRVDTAADLLTALSLSEYIPDVEKNDVDLNALFHMTSEDLKKIGIAKTSARVKILRTLVALNAAQLVRGKDHRGLSVAAEGGAGSSSH